MQNASNIENTIALGILVVGAAIQGTCNLLRNACLKFSLAS